MFWAANEALPDMSLVALLSAVFVVVASVAVFERGQAGWAWPVSSTADNVDVVRRHFGALSGPGWAWPVAWKPANDANTGPNPASSKAATPSSFGALVNLEASLVVSCALVMCSIGLHGLALT